VHTIPDIPNIKYEKQHPHRNVRDKDYVNEEMRVRQFIDPNELKH
jgi:hypothetical protein